LVLPFEVSAGEERYQREPAHNETPERIFERRWALSLLDRVVARLRDEFVQHGHLDHFNKLKVFWLGQAEAPYAVLAREMDTSEGALKVAIHGCVSDIANSSARRSRKRWPIRRKSNPNSAISLGR
jgi:RNA polymerase sigma-70 factor (ECF subfamily)